MIMADRSSVKGVDISYWQKGIDYEALKSAGVEYAIIRAGLSESPDKELEAHVKGCIDVGIPYGFYWYSYAGNIDEARREAAACVKAIAGCPAPAYPVFFDAEESSVARALGREAMTDVALAFVKAIEDSGYPAGVYANPSWLENEYNKSRLMSATDIWLAHWTWDPAKPSPYSYGQKMWQWGIINVKGYDVDADICYVDYPAITARWYDSSNKKTVEQLAREVIGGLWGNGVDRAAALRAAGYDYDAVQAEVNRILKEGSDKKSVGEIAVEVIRGKWGAGDERRTRLTAAGYDYSAVQAKVNEMLSGK